MRIDEIVKPSKECKAGLHNFLVTRWSNSANGQIREATILTCGSCLRSVSKSEIEIVNQRPIEKLAKAEKKHT